MKVVLFCGGLGLRIRDYSEDVPKPMIPIGYRPILWHVMKYYAYYGHKDFILCLGYRADFIKTYFRNYDEGLSNDFVLSEGGRNIELLNRDIHDWRITFVDTGITSSIGQRLKAVETYLEGEEVFLANYSDGLTDLPLPDMIDRHFRDGRIASMLCVKPRESFDVVRMDPRGVVTSMERAHGSGPRINGGYFIFKRDIFRYIEESDDLVEQPFERLIAEQQLLAYGYDGFWACMDTFKDRQELEEMHAKEEAPWAVWRTASGAGISRRP